MDGKVEMKAEIRKRMRALRRALPADEREEASQTVCGKLIRRNFRGTVAVYLASPEEIDLSAFINDLLRRGTSAVAPRWNGETYELARVRGLSDGELRPGPMKILEPAEADIVNPAEVDAWIIPALAFTMGGARLGYGGGWYDRLLSGAKGSATKTGVAHDFQIVDDLPIEPHDALVDDIVTDATIPL
jgi:5-formyltetrahydrofolate cyclo-ligase